MDGPQYHPSTSCVYHNVGCPVLLCIMTSVPGGERGVLLKSKYLSNAICAESFGFDIAVLKRFNVIWACLRRLHHRCIENIFPTLQGPVMKLFFYVCMACSAIFLLCMCEGTNWNATAFCL